MRTFEIVVLFADGEAFKFRLPSIDGMEAVEDVMLALSTGDGSGLDNPLFEEYIAGTEPDLVQMALVELKDALEPDLADVSLN